MYRLSPHSVLSAISGSLSLPALTFVVFLLLIQTSEEDDTSAYDDPYPEFDTISEADPSSCTICIPREAFYAVIGVLVLTLISIIACVCWRKNNTERAKESDSTEGLLSSSPEDVTPVPHTHSTTKQKLDAVSAVNEQETETADQKEEFLSAHKEVDKEPKENQRKLQKARTETAKLRDERQSQLEEVKREREENKRKLEDIEKELKNNKEMTMDEKQKLKGEIDHCVQQKQILKEIYTEKDKVLTHMDKLLQAVHTAAKSMSLHQTV